MASAAQITNTNTDSSIEQNTDNSILIKMISDIITNIQCPVCLQLCEPPLMSCPNGHFTCSTCLSRIYGDTLKKKPCPQCREQGFIRNLPYEKLAASLLAGTELKCPHSSDEIGGCCQSYKFGGLNEHLKGCAGLTQKYNCPCPRCTERNLYSLPELIKHMIINLGFNTDEEYHLSFLPSVAVGPLDALIGGELAKVEASEFGRNLGMRLNAHESICSYSASPVINYELLSDAYEDYNSCIIFPPYNFFENFKKEDNLLETNTSRSRRGSSHGASTNLTFLIDTAQIYLIRSTCSLTSDMVFCDATYLNSQFMDENDPHRVYGIMVNYNYNKEYTEEIEPSISTVPLSDEPEKKRSRRHTFEKIKYFESKYFDFEKYKSEMSEEVLNGTRVEKGINTPKHEAVGQLKWTLIF